MYLLASNVQKLILASLIFFMFVSQGVSQNLPTHLNGEGLKEWLKINYYDGQHTTLGYNTARSYMYNYIDNDNNSLLCVYSGYTVPWTYGGTGTNPAPLNCEHTVPQSFFSSIEPMRSDIHHLYPTYSNWNSVRSNYPLDEITDTETTKWMYLDTDQTTIPNSNIDQYSEAKPLFFEPREDHKGNAARSIFYFYTMYPGIAGSINQSGDPATLYQWHLQDQVGTTESQRNTDIAQYQGNRNPYVDFADAVGRAWLFAINSNAPSAPSSFTVTSVSSGLSVNWQDVTNETGYYVYRAVDGVNFSQIASLSANNTNYLDNSVASGLEYSYYIVPYNNLGIGETTSIVTN